MKSNCSLSYHIVPGIFYLFILLYIYIFFFKTWFHFLLPLYAFEFFSLFLCWVSAHLSSLSAVSARLTVGACQPSTKILHRQHHSGGRNWTGSAWSHQPDSSQPSPATLTDSNMPEQFSGLITAALKAAIVITSFVIHCYRLLSQSVGREKWRVEELDEFGAYLCECLSLCSVDKAWKENMQIKCACFLQLLHRAGVKYLNRLHLNWLDLTESDPTKLVIDACSTRPPTVGKCPPGSVPNEHPCPLSNRLGCCWILDRLNHTFKQHRL